MTIETITLEQVKELKESPIFYEHTNLTQILFPKEYAEIVRFQDEITSLAKFRDAEIQQSKIQYRSAGVPINSETAREIITTAKAQPTMDIKLKSSENWNLKYEGTATSHLANSSALTAGSLQKKIETITAKYDPRIETLCEQRYNFEKPILQMYDIMGRVNRERLNSADEPISITRIEYQTLKDLDKKYTQYEEEARKKRAEQRRTIVVLR